jgi:cytochrome b561
VFSYNGEGLFVLYVFAVIAKIVSQVLLIWMLLMIAFGWTISYEDLRDKDIFVIILAFVIMIHMMIAGLTFIDYGESYKYHDFGGVQGFILILLRIFLWVGFCVGIVMTRKTAPKKTLDFL